MSEVIEHVLSEDYQAKDASYFTNPRADFVDLLPADPKARILELGCGGGATGELALRTGKAGYYVGIEAFEPMAERARTVLSDVYTGDVERLDLPPELSGFDVLIMSEVLEHLTNPEAVVERLTRALKPGALVLASSPNICHWQNIMSLLKGRFEYTDSGMMDRTHLKWFTPYSFEKMFNEAGIETQWIGPLVRPARRTRWMMALLPITRPLTIFQINFHGRYRPGKV